MKNKKVYHTADVRKLVKEDGIPAYELLELAGKNVERDLDRGFELIMKSLDKIKEKFPDAAFIIDEGEVGVFLGDANKTSHRVIRGYTGPANLVQRSLIAYENFDLCHILQAGELTGCENMLGEDDDKEYKF